MKLFSKDLPPENASAEAKAAHIAKYKAYKAAQAAGSTQAPASEPKSTADILARSKQVVASVQQNAWRKYRHLQKTDPVAAGHFWRENKTAILACRS